MSALKSALGLAVLLVPAFCLAQEDENPVLKMKGKPLPAIVMTTTGGAKIKNSTLKGKVTIIDFWASWCVPCVQVSKVMETINAKYRKGLVVIGADCQEQSPMDLKKSLRTHPKKYTVTVKNDNYYDSFGLAGMPTVLIIDKHGIIRNIYTGYSSSFGETVDKNVADLLAEK